MSYQPPLYAFYHFDSDPDPFSDPDPNSDPDPYSDPDTDPPHKLNLSVFESHQKRV